MSKRMQMVGGLFFMVVADVGIAMGGYVVGRAHEVLLHQPAVAAVQSVSMPSITQSVKSRLINDNCVLLPDGVVICAERIKGDPSPGVLSAECAELRNGVMACASMDNTRGDL